jgi:hypothetical protein
MYRESISSGASFADLVGSSDFETKIFTRDNNIHHVQLLTAHVRSNGERQISIQIVAHCSKSHRFPQEAALALRTYALTVQSSYGRKAKSLKVRDLVNRAIA